MQMMPPAQAPTVPPDRVVLKVGDLSLTAAQFDQIVDVLPPQSQAQVRGPMRKQFAEQLVRVLVLADEAKRRKLDQTPTFKTQEMFNENNLLANLAFKELGKETKVTEEDARKYYDLHQTDYQEVTARQILVRAQGSPTPVKAGQKELSDAEALAKAQDLRKKIVDGADFAKLAETESDEAATAANGGSLGTFRHGQKPPTVEKTAFAMKPGEISEPVKSQFGYHIIKVEAVQTKPFETVQAELMARLQPEATQKALQEMVTKAGPFYDPEYFPAPKPFQIPVPPPPPAATPVPPGTAK
jgi:peptidyl-prolyl cis-trans isomerase C